MSDSIITRILVVDDNPSVCNDIKKILTPESQAEQKDEMKELKSILFETSKKPMPNLSYDIDIAYDGKTALQCVQTSLDKNQPYALAFIDIIMPPGWDGIETTQKIWEIDPDIQIVICTAYAEYSWNDIVEKCGVNENFLILKKPFENIEIRQMACCLTQKWLASKKSGHQYDKLEEELKKTYQEVQEMLERSKKYYK